MTDRRENIISILHRYRRGEAGFAEDAAAEIEALFALIQKQAEPFVFYDEDGAHGEKDQTR